MQIDRRERNLQLRGYRRPLTWARETAGLSVEEAAGKLGLRDSAKATAVEKLRALEEGQRDLRLTFLQKAASLWITTFLNL